MDHKSIRYKATQITHQSQGHEHFKEQLMPTFNQYISSQCSYKSSNSNSNSHPVKSRSKHEIFRPSIRSEEQQSDDYRMHPDSVSQCTHRYTTRVQNQYGLNKSRQTHNQIQSRYKTIQNFMQEQNYNLKQQNNLLLQQLRKANNKEKKYRDMYAKTHQQLMIVSQQRDYARQQFSQLKDIVQNQMSAFQQKLSLITLSQTSYKQQDREMLANDFNSFKRKVSQQKIDSDISDNTNSDTM